MCAPLAGLSESSRAVNCLAGRLVRHEATVQGRSGAHRGFRPHGYARELSPKTQVRFNN